MDSVFPFLNENFSFKCMACTLLPKTRERFPSFAGKKEAGKNDTGFAGKGTENL